MKAWGGRKEMARIRLLFTIAMRRLPQTPAIVFLLLSLFSQSLAQRARSTGKTPAQPKRESQVPQGTGLLRVWARWSAQRGVSRYRFQLARDRKFNDIIVDRVVLGTEYEVADIARGKYFWRVAPLGQELGQFSPPRPIEPSKKMQMTATEPPISRPAVTIPTVTPSPSSVTVRTSGFVSEGGWRAAIGSVARPTLMHLRSASAPDVVALNSDGLAFALELDSGVTFWATRTSIDSGTTTKRPQFSPVPVPTGAGLDNALVTFDGGVRVLQGASGRELWRAPMTSGASSGAAVALDTGLSAVFVVSNSTQRMIILDGGNGRLIAETKLPGRVFGSPVPYAYGGTQGVIIAFEDGRIEIRDKNANVVRSGSAQSSVTTPPLFVPGAKGLVLVGTRNGLTALDAGDLHALGRVAIKDDAPRGILAAADLDGDGATEVIMITERGQVMAINAADGKIRWEHDGAIDAETSAFVDLNADDEMDVIVAAGPAFAMALSGRDGSVIWRAEEQPELANHAPALTARMLICKQVGAKFLIVGSDPSGASLRAVQLSPDALRSRNR
jgi:outer membrane protein assembly factor BamB